MGLISPIYELYTDAQMDDAVCIEWRMSPLLWDSIVRHPSMIVIRDPYSVPERKSLFGVPVHIEKDSDLVLIARKKGYTHCTEYKEPNT